MPRTKQHRQAKARHVPDAHSPDIAGRLLLQKSANLLDLGPSAGRVVEEIAQLAAVGLDINSSLCGSRIALEHQDLMLRAAFLLYGVHHASGFVESLRCSLCSRKSEARRTAVGR